MANGEPLIVEQTRWKHITIESCSENGLFLHCKKDDDPFPNSMRTDRVVRPDFALIRNFPTDLHDNDFKSKLIGMMFCGLPAVNTLQSVFMGMHRPLVYAELLKLQKRLQAEGKKALEAGVWTPPPPPPATSDGQVNPTELYKYDFPLIPMRYYANTHSDLTAQDGIRSELRAIDFPVVVKIGTAHGICATT